MLNLEEVYILNVMSVVCTFVHKIVLTCDDIREWLVYTRDDKKIKYLNGSGIHLENKIKRVYDCLDVIIKI